MQRANVKDDLTYDQPNIRDHTLEDRDLSTTCPLDNGRHRVAPVYSLGQLDLLPLELLQAIFLQVDLRTLTDFRRVNQRAMQVVDSIPQYQAILKHSIGALRALLSIQVAAHLSCSDFYRCLCTAYCQDCGDFAGYIYLLTCTRVCFLCFTTKRQYLPLTTFEANQQYGLKSHLSTELIRMKSLTGLYTSSERVNRKRLSLIDPSEAQHMAVSIHGSVEVVQHIVVQNAAERTKRYEKRLQEAAPNRPQPRRPRDTPVFDGHSSNSRRFMATVRAPWLDTRTKEAVWGFHCVGCSRQYATQHWRRKFIAESFERHITDRGPIIGGEHQPGPA